MVGDDVVDVQRYHVFYWAYCTRWSWLMSRYTMFFMELILLKYWGYSPSLRLGVPSKIRVKTAQKWHPGAARPGRRPETGAHRAICRLPPLGRFWDLDIFCFFGSSSHCFLLICNGRKEFRTVAAQGWHAQIEKCKQQCFGGMRRLSQDLLFAVPNFNHQLIIN